MWSMSFLMRSCSPCGQLFLCKRKVESITIKFSVKFFGMSMKFGTFAVLKLCLTMRYPLYIEASEETLRKLDEKFKPVAEDRFLYCLQQKRWTIEDIHKFNACLQISYDYTLKEYERIQELRKTYNREYPTDHKQYLSTAIELMGKMRSTLLRMDSSQRRNVAVR